MTVVQLPTIPGKVDGIVGWEPCVLQCRKCGAIATQEGRSAATFIILSGYRFHGCEGKGAGRRCPDCLAAEEAACPNRGRHA